MSARAWCSLLGLLLLWGVVALLVDLVVIR